MRVKQFFQTELASEKIEESEVSRLTNFRLSTIIVQEKWVYKIINLCFIFLLKGEVNKLLTLLKNS